jgi:hypothetical protein
MPGILKQLINSYFTVLFFYEDDLKILKVAAAIMPDYAEKHKRNEKIKK